MKKLIYITVLLALSSCSARKAAFTEKQESTKIELAANQDVIDYSFQAVDTSTYCETTLTEAIALDTLGRPTTIVKSKTIKTRNNKITIADTLNVNHTSNTAAAAVSTDTISSTSEKVVGRSSVEPAKRSYWWLLLVGVVLFVYCKYKRYV